MDYPAKASITCDAFVRVNRSILIDRWGYGRRLPETRPKRFALLSRPSKMGCKSPVIICKHKKICSENGNVQKLETLGAERIPRSVVVAEKNAHLHSNAIVNMLSATPRSARINIEREILSAAICLLHSHLRQLSI